MLYQRLLILALACLGSLSAQDEKKAEKALPKPILLVLSQHPHMGEEKTPTGFFLSEASHPWHVFHLSGFPVQLASVKGGFAPLDPKSFKLDDPVNKTFMTNFGSERDGRQGVAKTLPLSQADPADYSAIFFAGGHGAMWDFPLDEKLAQLTAAIYEQGGAVGAVCHGPAALVNVTLSSNQRLVAGKKVAVFTNSEERAVKLTETVPFLLEDAMKKAGAEPVVGPDFKENAVLDERLATGQNPASATKTAELLLKALGYKPAPIPEPEAKHHE
ncbi:MAG: type 1 glutamine amidotransferase domain-containing protein [Verrucomicrobiales bacterium]